MNSKPLNIVIATRESRLALWQAEHVQALLAARGHQVSLLGMTTLGDQILDRTLSKVGGKGLFVKELETALEDGRADIAVHSLKDVPMELPEGFALACVMEREDARDAFVSPRYARLQDLPQGAVVGTSSLRRTVLLQALRPDLRIEPLRGNLDTRLRKLDEGQYEAIVLADAGLKRLGLQERIRCEFDESEMLPAAGQGALGIEVRADRSDLIEALAPLAHPPTWPRTPGSMARNCTSTRPGATRNCARPWCAPARAGRRPRWHRPKRWARRWPRSCANAARTRACSSDANCRPARPHHAPRTRGLAVGAGAAGTRHSRHGPAIDLHCRRARRAGARACTAKPGQLRRDDGGERQRSAAFF